MSLIRIQLAEENEAERSGFRFLIESEHDMEVVAESPNGAQACRDYIQHKPDVLVMGLSMTDMNGIQVMRDIHSRYAEARILFLSMHSGPVVNAALWMGARGFISKQRWAIHLVTAIRKVMLEERYVDPELELTF